MQDSFRRLWKL